jgi:hypothetical protein
MALESMNWEMLCVSDGTVEKITDQVGSSVRISPGLQATFTFVSRGFPLYF